MPVEHECAEGHQTRSVQTDGIVDLCGRGDRPPRIGRIEARRSVVVGQGLGAARLESGDHPADPDDAVATAQPRERGVRVGEGEQIVDGIDLAGLDHQARRAGRDGHRSSLRLTEPT